MTRILLVRRWRVVFCPIPSLSMTENFGHHKKDKCKVLKGEEKADYLGAFE